MSIIAAAKDLDDMVIGSVVALHGPQELVNVALKTNEDEWGLAGIAKPLTSAVLFRAAVERDGFVLVEIY